MKDAVRTVVEQCARESHAGEVSFGTVVGRLAGAGVESYLADYRARATTYYLPNGEAHSVALHGPAIPIAAEFDKEAVQAAIRGAQGGQVKYPQFMALTMAAGCVGYIVWIQGRHVSYFGRRGEVHVERFPD